MVHGGVIPAGHALAHRRMVHSPRIMARRAMIHAGVGGAHVRHVQDRPSPALRRLGAQTLARRDRRERVPRAVDRLGEQRVRDVRLRLDDHVVALGDADAQLIHRHRVHVVAVGRDDGHLEARDADVEEAHRRAVDEPQTQPLAFLNRNVSFAAGGLPLTRKA